MEVASRIRAATARLEISGFAHHSDPTLTQLIPAVQGWQRWQ
jgi:hypothetical protein